MNRTVRGFIVFVAAIATILFWAPLSGKAAPRPGGGTNNDIYFGPFKYLTIHSVMREPEFTITREWNGKGLARTLGATAILWTAMALLLRRRPAISEADRPQPQ